MAKTNSTFKVKAITFEEILDAMNALKLENTDIPSAIKVATDVQEKLDAYFGIQELLEKYNPRYSLTGKAEPPVHIAAIYGIEIIEDERMRPGTWRIVR